MFDNPRKELEKLQQELLAAEAEQDAESAQEEEDYVDEPMEWDDDDRAPLSRSYTDSMDDTLIWQNDEPLEEEATEEPPEKPEKKHYIGLKFAIALELLGIAALFWWWYLWIR